jgi:hypothetical protein
VSKTAVDGNYRYKLPFRNVTPEAADRRFCGVVAWVAGGKSESPRWRNAVLVAWWHGLLVDAGIAEAAERRVCGQADGVTSTSLQPTALPES